MKLLLAAVLAAAMLCSASAQDAAPEACPDVTGPLNEVKAKLAAAEAQLAEHQEAVSALEAVKAQVADLTAKLAAAEQATASTKQAAEASNAEVAELKTKLAAAEKEAARLKESVTEAAQAEIAELKSKLDEAEMKLRAADRQAAQLKQSWENSREESRTCTAEKSNLEVKYSGAKKLADTAELRIKSWRDGKEAAEKKAQEVQKKVAKLLEEVSLLKSAVAEHEGAWLPHWLHLRSAAALEAAGPALEQAKELWSTHAAPSFGKGLALAKEKALELAALLEKHGGESMPKVKAALAAAVAKVQAVLQSEQVKAAKAGAAQLAERALSTLDQVSTELETQLIAILAKYPSTVPLARKPYATYIVYMILSAPLVALGLPLLGRLASGGGGSEDAAAGAAGGSRGPKGAKRPKNKRTF